MLGPYDVLVLVVLGVGYFAGRAKGFAWQISGIATLALGFVAAAAFATSVAPLFPDAWPADLRRYAAWSAIYAVVTIAIYLATMAVSKKMKQHDLEELDRRFGGALGAVKAGLLVAVLSLVAVAGSERAREFVQESTSGLLLAHVGTLARPLLPERIGRALDRSLERLGPHGGSLEADPAVPVTPFARPASPRPAAPPLTPRLDGSGPSSPRPAPVIARTPRPTRPQPAASPEAPPITTDTPAMDDENAGDDDETPPATPPGKRPRPRDDDDAPGKPEPRDPLVPPR